MTLSEDGAGSRSPRERLGNPVVQFTLAGITAVLVVGVAAGILLSHAAEDEAVRDAKRVSVLAGTGIVEPVLTDALVAGDPAALARLDRVVRERVLGREGVVRVKVWTGDSEVVYSDEPRLIGDTFELGADDLEVLNDGGVDAGPSDLSEPENRYENSDSDLLEVYLQVHTASGTPLLFETYIEESFVNSAGDRVWSTLAPILIGALLILAALQLPLAASLARRLRRGQDERETLLERAIDASEMERRRIAQDLHDGVVQDLAGVSYSIAAVANRAGSGAEVDKESLNEGASRLRQSVRDLRGLLVEIYPADLHRAGIEAALTDVLAGLNSRGLETSLEVEPGIDLPEPVETLFFRIAQEALRNVVAHADAECVRIRIEMDGAKARLEVNDDGRGFTFGHGHEAEGHFGLRMLSDLAAEAGGTFSVESSPGEGTIVRVEVPAR